jgi:hypothetical protein
MVAVFPESQQSNLFPYLKPCEPAPGIAKRSSAISADPLDRPVCLSQRRGRLLSLLCGAAQASAISLSLWLPSLWQREAVVTVPAVITEQQSSDALWTALGSDELAEVMLAAKEKQIAQTLNVAEQARLQAQQLRIEAESQAKNLTVQAAEQARKTTVEALRQADVVALDATYVGAEQVIHAEAGADVTLKFAARIQCKDGSFGETAISTPKDSRIKPREVRNLAACYPQVETAAGEPIGQAGDWGVAFFKVE